MNKSPSELRSLIVVVIFVTVIANLAVPIVNSFNKEIETLNRLNLTFR